MEHYDEFEQYLRLFGYRAGNDMFTAHSWNFRNALVCANYRNVAKGIEPTTEYLVFFLRNLLLGENNELKKTVIFAFTSTTINAKMTFQKR